MFYRPLLSILLSVLLAAGAFAQVRSGDSRPPPVRLVEIIAPRTLWADDVGHFRAEPAGRPTRHVNYLWDFGDGTLSVGNLVSHVYRMPGIYTVTVVGQNETGTDTLQTRLTVVPRFERVSGPAAADEELSAVTVDSKDGATPSSRRPARVTFPRRALFGGAVHPEEGGHTWVLRTDLWAERAQDRLLYYRLRGYRADVYVDTTGVGSPAHRIVVGQFETVEEALAARSWLPVEAGPPWLLSFTSLRPDREE